MIPIGEGRILYDLPLVLYPLQVDRLVHGFGSAIICLVAWEVLRSHLTATDRVPWSVVYLVALVGMGAGAIGEVAEFASSSFAPSNVGGYVNTGWDLVFNLVGCAIAAGWVRRRGTTGLAENDPTLHVGSATSR